jgi:hypothetical protein
MIKYRRLIRNCINQMNPESGNAEAFKDALADLGRWVLTQYLNGKIEIRDIFNDKNERTLKEFIRTVGEHAEKNGFGQTKSKTMIECIADSHNKLSKVYKIYNNNQIYSNPGSDVPEGVAAILAELLIDICAMCYYYKIEVGDILLNKFESLK